MMTEQDTVAELRSLHKKTGNLNYKRAADELETERRERGNTVAMCEQLTAELEAMRQSEEHAHVLLDRLTRELKQLASMYDEMHDKWQNLLFVVVDSFGEAVGVPNLNSPLTLAKGQRIGIQYVIEKIRQLNLPVNGCRTKVYDLLDEIENSM